MRVPKGELMKMIDAIAEDGDLIDAEFERGIKVTGVQDGYLTHEPTDGKTITIYINGGAGGEHGADIHGK